MTCKCVILQVAQSQGNLKAPRVTLREMGPLSVQTECSYLLTFGWQLPAKLGGCLLICFQSLHTLPTSFL